MEGISNKTIVKVFAEKPSNDIKKILSVFFPSNFVTRFTTFYSMLRESAAQYLFIIMNADRIDEKGTHWWSFLDLHPKKEIFYQIVSASKVSRNSFFKNIRKHSIRYFMVSKSLTRKTIKSL